MLKKNRFGGYTHAQVFGRKTGAGFLDLDPVKKNINAVGGLPNLGESNIRNLPRPQYKEITNFKPIPKVLLAENKALNNVRIPIKKLNNLKFEL